MTKYKKMVTNRHTVGAEARRLPGHDCLSSAARSVIVDWSMVFNSALFKAHMSYILFDQINAGSGKHSIYSLPPPPSIFNWLLP